MIATLLNISLFPWFCKCYKIRSSFCHAMFHIPSILQIFGANIHTVNEKINDLTKLVFRELQKKQFRGPFRRRYQFQQQIKKLTQTIRAISVLYVLSTLSHIILTITLKGKDYYSCFTHEETEAWRGWVTFSGSKRDRAGNHAFLTLKLRLSFYFLLLSNIHFILHVVLLDMCVYYFQ